MTGLTSSDRVVAFSQRDPRWRGLRLGTAEETIGRAGCLLCSAASLLATWGWDTDPACLNAYLVAHGGYVDGGRFVFGAINGRGCRLRELIRCARTPAPVDRLQAALAEGAGVLIEVDFAPGGTRQQHWAWLTELADLSGQVVDPWQLPGGELVDLGRYLAKGWSPARGIFAAAVYDPGPGQS